MQCNVPVSPTDAWCGVLLKVGSIAPNAYITLRHGTGSDLKRPERQLARLDGGQTRLNGRMYNDAQHSKDDDHAHRGHRLQLQQQQDLVPGCKCLNYCMCNMVNLGQNLTDWDGSG